VIKRLSESSKKCNKIKDMTKSELILRLADRHRQLMLRDAEMVVRMVLEEMSETLAKGGRIEIRGFGSFGLNVRPARVGRNPKSGETVMVPPKVVPHFKPGKELRERVDFSDSTDASAAQPAREDLAA
jgi:integration host factor subunit beta